MKRPFGVRFANLQISDGGVVTTNGTSREYGSRRASYSAVVQLYEFLCSGAGQEKGITPSRAEIRSLAPWASWIGSTEAGQWRQDARDHSVQDDFPGFPARHRQADTRVR